MELSGTSGVAIIGGADGPTSVFVSGGGIPMSMMLLLVAAFVLIVAVGIVIMVSRRANDD